MRIGAVVPLSALVAGCALPSPSSTAGPTSTEQVVSAEAETGVVVDDGTAAGSDPAPGGAEAEPQIGLRADADVDADPGASTPEGIVAGTDSSTPVTAAPIEPAVRDRLIGFGEAYLGFDYRNAQAERVEQLRPFVVPSLLDELTQPLPASLAESLIADERIVEAEFVDLEPLGGETFRLRFLLSTSRTGTGVEEEQRALLVSLDGRQLVSDVR